jgi:hypothetical protein
MGSIRQGLQTQPKNIKSYQNTKSTNRNKKISNKSMFSTTSKVKRRQKIVWGYLTELAGSTQNPKKIIRTPNLPIINKRFAKKVCLVP